MMADHNSHFFKKGQRFRTDDKDFYVLSKWIGGGGNGEVWEIAGDPGIVIKIFHSDYQTKKRKRRFIREINFLEKNWKRFSFLPEIKTSNRKGSPPFFVMKHYLPLKLDELAAWFPDPKSRIELCKLIGNGLSLLHKEKIAHRDIKPSNILFDRPTNGPLRPILADAGLIIEEGLDRLTTSDERVGSRGYTAPECLLGCNRLGQDSFLKADVFSFAATCFSILTGKKRLIDESPIAITVENESSLFANNEAAGETVYRFLHLASLPDPTKRLSIDGCLSYLEEALSKMNEQPAQATALRRDIRRFLSFFAFDSNMRLCLYEEALVKSFVSILFPDKRECLMTVDGQEKLLQLAPLAPVKEGKATYSAKWRKGGKFGEETLAISHIVIALCQDGLYDAFLYFESKIGNQSQAILTEWVWEERKQTSNFSSQIGNNIFHQGEPQFSPKDIS